MDGGRSALHFEIKGSMRKKDKKKNLGFPQKLLALAMVWLEQGKKQRTVHFLDHGLLAFCAGHVGRGPERAAER